MIKKNNMQHTMMQFKPPERVCVKPRDTTFATRLLMTCKQLSDQSLVDFLQKHKHSMQKPNYNASWKVNIMLTGNSIIRIARLVDTGSTLTHIIKSDPTENNLQMV